MKFEKTLEFNAVREWSPHYIHYERLKHAIYEMEQMQASLYKQGSRPQTRTTLRPPQDDEEQGLIVTANSHDQLIGDQQLPYEALLVQESDFKKSFAQELEAVNEFYISKERELLQQVQALVTNINENGHFQAISAHQEEHDESYGTPTEDDQLPLTANNASATTSFSDLLTGQCGSAALKNTSIIDQLKELYINLCSLKDYSVLNYAGFKKILKKHDKVLTMMIPLQHDSELAKCLEAQYFWRQNVVGGEVTEQNKIYPAIEKLTDIYGFLSCNGDKFKAAQELCHHLREFVTWERSTVWKEMVGQERRLANTGIISAFDRTRAKFRLRFPLIGSFLISNNIYPLLISILIFAVLMSVDIFGDGPKNRCFAVLIFASVMWATEAIPLFVTSMLIPLLLVVFSVLTKSKDDNSQLMSADEAAKFLFGKMWASVIMLLLGGFTIAAALSKFGIAKRMATMILSRAGTKSWAVLLAIMFVAWFMSMWISNVAAPVLCFSVIQPILRTLEPGNQFAISLIMGIALSSNIGGLATPISSPQNAIALTFMHPPVSWVSWLAVSLPISFLSIISCWLMLLYFYQPGKSTPFVQPIHVIPEPLTKKQVFIIAVSIGTILLWCLESSVSSVMGNSGIIAIVPMVAFFGSGILDKDDFNSFLWSVIMLAMGGICLGTAVENTNLLSVVGQGIARALEGHNLLIALIAFCSLVLVVATFISHTVSALIILPLVQEVGNVLPGNHANLLVMGAALMCSGAMGLPISGFPNINAVSIEDATGRPYLKTRDFLKVGIPMSLAVLGITVSIGYGIMFSLGL